MTCYNCQKEIVEGSRYCYHCGAAQKPLTPPPGVRKPLRRSRKHKVIAGVCGGFAEHFGLDVSLMRVIWLLIALFGGGGLIAYLICWVVVPLEEAQSAAPVPISQQS
ncbi:MAG: PspC domain-containing protein [Acidobacteria bacterium]|nr:PspC domain-containing protein [Acidobacteriota bacterium]